MKYKYSIIIPHINEGYLLDITLDSIYNKFQYDNYEIIIVDDGSSNLTDLDFINKHLLKSKIKVFLKKDIGLSNAKNYGAMKSTGDILIFIDSHMYFKNDFLTKLDNLLKNNDKIDLLQPFVGNIQDKAIKGTIYKIKDFVLNSTWDKIKNSNTKDFIVTPNIIGCAMIVKKEVFKNLKGFNKYFIRWGCEDLEFSMRAWLNGYKSYLSKKIFVAHYFKESFKNTIVTNEHVCNNRILFAYTCFQNSNRLNKILESIKNHYGEITYNDIYLNIHKNKGFWTWLKNQQKKFKHNDDWYFSKFDKYYLEFNNIDINEKV